MRFASAAKLHLTLLDVPEYSNNLRLILCANSTSKIIGPIRSRCLLLRVGAPNEEEVCLPWLVLWMLDS